MKASSASLISSILNFFSFNLNLFFFKPFISDCRVIPFKIEFDSGVVYKTFFLRIHAVLELPSVTKPSSSINHAS